MIAQQDNMQDNNNVIHLIVTSSINKKTLISVTQLKKMKCIKYLVNHQNQT